MSLYPAGFVRTRLIGLGMLLTVVCPPAWALASRERVAASPRPAPGEKPSPKGTAGEVQETSLWDSLDIAALPTDQLPDYVNLAKQGRTGVAKKIAKGGGTSEEKAGLEAAKAFYDVLLDALAAADALAKAQKVSDDAGTTLAELRRKAAGLAGSRTSSSDAENAYRDVEGQVKVAGATGDVSGANVAVWKAKLAKLAVGLRLAGLQRDIADTVAAIAEIETRLRAPAAGAPAAPTAPANPKAPATKPSATSTLLRFAALRARRVKTQDTSKPLTTEERAELEVALADARGYLADLQGQANPLRQQLAPGAALVVAETNALGGLEKAGQKKTEVEKEVAEAAAERRSIPQQSYAVGPLHAGMAVGVDMFPLQRDKDLPQDFRLFFLSFGPYYDGFCKHEATGANRCRVGFDALLPGVDTTSRAFAGGAMGRFQYTHPLGVSQSGLTWFSLGGEIHAGMIGKTGGTLQAPDGTTSALGGRFYGVLGADLSAKVRFSPYYSADLGFGGSFYLNQDYSGGAVHIFARFNFDFKKRAAGMAPVEAVPAAAPTGPVAPAPTAAPVAAPAPAVSVVLPPSVNIGL